MSYCLPSARRSRCAVVWWWGVTNIAQVERQAHNTDRIHTYVTYARSYPGVQNARSQHEGTHSSSITCRVNNTHCTQILLPVPRVPTPYYSRSLNKFLNSSARNAHSVLPQQSLRSHVALSLAPFDHLRFEKNIVNDVNGSERSVPSQHEQQQHHDARRPEHCRIATASAAAK